MRTTTFEKETIADVTYIPLGSVDHANEQLIQATSAQNTSDYSVLRSAMDAEYYWRGMVDTFVVADGAFRSVSSATHDLQDISTHVMTRTSNWVGVIELATEGSRLYGALVAYTQGVGDAYAGVEEWARSGVRPVYR